MLFIEPSTTNSPPQQDKDDVARLRRRIDSFVMTLGDDYPMQTVGRALMAKAAELIVEDAGMLPAVWATQRIEHLISGHLTDETLDLYVRSPNV